MEQELISRKKVEPEAEKKELIFPCHLKKIPLWLVLLDNIPTLLLFFLGILIIDKLSTVAAVLFGLYALFSVVWFWAKICPYCHHFDTMACPCGYGVISSKFFRRRSGKSFKKVFRKNIGIQFPNWFVPQFVAIYLLLKNYSDEILVISVAFALIGFIIIPVISKYVGCKSCEIRDECPWMEVQRKKKAVK